jgi:hypothetical protein
VMAEISNSVKHAEMLFEESFVVDGFVVGTHVRTVRQIRCPDSD